MTALPTERTETRVIEVEQMVPSASLAAFLDGAIGRSSDPVRITKIGEGRSNLTFRVERGVEAWVLRRPPLGDLPETAHDMLREHRVLSALAATPVRAPRPAVLCADPSVIGQPFYLMEPVDGVVIRDCLPEAFDESSRAGIGHEVVDALSELHAVDPASVGLGDLGRPDGYTARQVGRWTKQWAFMRTRELEDIEAVRGWLEAHVPTRSPTAIVHGDYKLDNVVFAPQPPARLRAILDWELATLGDPLADLGYLMVFWPEPGEEGVSGLDNPTRLPGFPRRSDLIARYEERTGFEMTDLTFYRTLAMWKLAILSEGLYKRYLAGKSDTDWPAVLREGVPRMAATARGWCGA